MKQMPKSIRTILLAGLFLALLLPALAGTDNPAISAVSYLRFDDVTTVSAHQADNNAELDNTTQRNESFFDVKHIIPFSICSSAKAEETPEYLTIKINWVGDEDKPEMRPQSNLYLYIKKDGGKSTQYATSGYTNWETQTTAPLKNADGSDCVYELDYVQSYLYPAYTVTETKFENGVLNITFQHQPSIDYDLQITWSDDNNSNGLRPETLSAEDVALNYRGGTETWTPVSMEKNDDGSWTAHFKNLPTYYRSSDGKVGICDPSAYRYEVQIDGMKPHYQPGLVYGKFKRDDGDYERIYTHLTVQYTLQTVTVRATYKMQSYLISGLYSEVNWPPAWKYAETLGIELPDSVRMTVLSNGTPIDRADATVTYARESSGAYPTMEKAWYLPKYDADGNEIDYGTLSVDYSPSMEKGELSGEFVQDVRTSGNLTVTISTQIYGIRAVEMPATWNDEGNALAVRPTTLSATLLKDGAPYSESVTLNVDAKGAVSGYPDSWKHLLQRDADGHYIQYSIQLNDLPAYYDVTVSPSPAYSAETGYGKPTTNISKLNLNTTLTLKTQTAKATVLWEGDGIGSETELKNRPKAANLKLEYTADGGATWQSFWGKDVFAVTMGDNSNEWTYEWSALPAVDAQGNAIEYRVVPADTSSMYVTSVDEPQYEKDIDGNVTHSNFTIHNSYNDNWNYTIDLKWNEADPVEKYKIEKVTNNPYTTYTVQYQLSISVQKAYDVGALEVRIPYELFDRRDGTGTGTVVNRFSLGPETNPSGNYSFTYRIDDKGTPDTSDDEVVFYNYKPLNASDNCVIMVEYNIQPKDIVDCSIGSLTAKATGRYDGQTADEMQQSGPITYRVDTGVEISNHSKTVVGPKYYWDTNYGAQPDDFDMTKYNYVEYKVSAYWRWNQPNTLYYVEKPGNGGEVYRVRRYSTNIKFTADPETNEYIWSDSRSGANSTSTEYYVLVRYPRIPHEDPMNPGQTTYEADYQNTLEFRLLGDDQHPDDKGENDKNDVVIAANDTTMHWTDYEFHYDGELFSATKTMGGFRSGALTVLEYGGYAEASCYLTMDVKGYNLLNGYSMELKDDAVYLCATINGSTTNYVRLTEEDYEFSGKPALVVTLTGVDRTNGQSISGHVPDGSFILWGRVAGGEWEEIDRLTMTSSYATVTLADITDKGYTQLRLTTPEDLQDEAHIVLRGFNIRMKGSSPKVAQWIKEDGLTMMTVQNLAAFNVYAKNDQGQMQWANPYSSSTNSFSKQRGLDEEDKAEFGAYQYRRNYDAQLYPAKESAQMIKRVDAPLDYDATNEIITAHFSILEYETINNVSLPQEVYDAKCQNGAVIYDLLPKGFVYASDKGVQVVGANKGIDYRTSSTGVNYYEFIANKSSAALVSVRTIDDYRGTGRQMVIFTIKSMLEDGKNTIADYSNWYTGFGVQFYARASYDDVISGKTLYNITAAQRDDGNVIGGGYTERGYGATSREDIFVLDENGQRALYDVNNDGVVSEETNTMYGYAEVTPSMIQTIENGLSKTVKGRSGLYQKDDIVDLNGRYSYKLRLTAAKNGETSNVVFYDILENAANTGGASGELAGWKGTFIGVNTRVAKELGIAPVVLYSTEKLSYNDPDTLLIESNPDAWSTTPPEDLSTVTAIAFDLRTAADGSKFIFSEDSTVEVEIIMQAPDGIQPSECAYNRPAYNSTFKPHAAQEGYTSFNISSRTTLRLRDLQDFEFVKQFVKDDDTVGPLANARFSLYLCTNTDEGHKHDRPGSGTGCWGTAVRSASSTTDGKVRFEDLDTGTYAIVEAYVRSGFDLLRNTYWVFTVDATNGTVSDPITMGAVTSDEVQMKQADGTWTLLNQRSSIEIEINKTWKDDGEQLIRPKTLIFDLYRNGVLYRTQEVEAKSGTLGVVFKNVPIRDEYGNNFAYKAVERVPEGYAEENGGAADVTVSINKQQHVKFTNTRLGVLDIVKRIQGSAAATPFGFTITLTDVNGNPLKLAEGETITARRFTTDAGDYATEALALNAEGKIHVSIAPDETLRLIGLPEGTKWQVAEDDTDYTVTSSVNPAAGTVGSTVNPSVVFTNVPQPTQLTLNVTKGIEGKLTPDTSKTFTFVLEAITENAPMPAPATATVQGSGSASFPAISFTQEGTFEYRVYEKAGSASGYTYDTTVYTVSVQVKDVNGRLTAEYSVKNGETAAEALHFTNRYHAEGSLNLTATKTVNGALPKADQVFDFELTSSAGTPGVHQVKQNVLGNVAFDSIPYTQEDVGKTYTYTVKETSTDGRGMTVDKTVYTVNVTVTDNGDGTLVIIPTYRKDAQTVSTMTFNNIYSATGGLTLTAYKTVNGQIPTVGQLFSFHLKNGANTPAVSQTKQNAGGTITFDPLNYTLDDAGKTYTYTVKETTQDGSGLTTDKTVYTVTVGIEDNKDGTLSVTPVYNNGTENIMGMHFDNTYSATGSLTLTAYKTVNGQTPTDEQVFDFELTSGAGTPTVKQVKQNVGGTVTFDPLDYTLANAGKTYSYTLKEISPDGKGISADKTVYTIYVKVEDNGNGTLKLTVTADNGENNVTRLSFDNTYAATGSLKLMADKTVNGKTPAADQCYTFALESGEDTPAVKQIKENELGLVAFDEISYTLDDAGKTYTYTVKEATQDGNGLTADKTVYTVTTSIKDNKDGTLSVTPVYSNGTENVTVMRFQNTLVGSIELSKRVEGGTVQAGEEFLFTVTFEDENGASLTDSFPYTGSKTGTIMNGGTLTLKDGETITISDVPVGTGCTIAEKGSVRYTTTVNGQTASKVHLTVAAETMPAAFVNTMVTTDFTVTKEWQGGNGGAISLTLYANGEKMEPQPSYSRNGDTYTYNGLPKYDAQGEPIRYAAKERYMSGYMTIYKNVAPYEAESSFIYDGGTIINRAVTEIAVRKVWTGMDENEERPEITLTLYCNGQVVNKKPKLDKNGWYHFYNLPIRNDPYYVVETPVDGYATSYENVGNFADATDCAYDGGTITNHKIPKTGDNSHSDVYLMLLLISVAFLLLCHQKAKRKRDV